jgi:hypothetical protein
VNIYRTSFSRRCPINGAVIYYELKLWSSATVIAEDMQAAIDGLPGAILHEEMADLLTASLPGRQIIEGMHGFILIRTERGAP